MPRDITAGVATNMRNRRLMKSIPAELEHMCVFFALQNYTISVMSPPFPLGFLTQEKKQKMQHIEAQMLDLCGIFFNCSVHGFKNF